MTHSVQLLAKQFELSTKLFANVLEGVSDEEGSIRLQDRTNHLRWIAGHLLTIRNRNAIRFGAPIAAFAHADKYAVKDMPPPNARPLDVSIIYPSVKEILEAWRECSAYLVQAVKSLTEEQVLAEGSFSTPLGGKTVLDNLAFLAYHEAFHIGQMSIIRKSIGLSSISFK